MPRPTCEQQYPLSLQALAAPLKKRCKSFKNGPRAGRQLWLDLLATTLATLRSAVAQLQQRAEALPPEQIPETSAAGTREGSAEAGAEAGAEAEPMDTEQAANEEPAADGEAPSDAAAGGPSAAGEAPSGRAPRRKAAAAAAAAVEAERGGPIARSGGTPPPATARTQLLQDTLAVMRHCYSFAKSSVFAGHAVMGANEEPHTLARILAPAASSKVDQACVGCVGGDSSFCVCFCRLCVQTALPVLLL